MTLPAAGPVSRRPARVPARPVAILCATAWSVRNVVLGGVLDALEARGVTARVFTSAGADNSLAEAWQADDPRRRELLRPAAGPPGLAERVTERLWRAGFAQRHGLTTHRIFARWRLRDAPAASKASEGAARVLARVAGGPYWLNAQAAFLEAAARARQDLRDVAAQLRALDPPLLVSTAGVVRDELPYLRAARDLGLPVLGCILSFDNLTSKGVPPRFDHYAVWGPWMRRLLLRLDPALEPARVEITGTPQFDLHRDPRFRWARDATLYRLGLPPGVRYLLYGANCATYTPTEPDLVERFAALALAAPELAGHRIVVRPHPGDDPARWAALAGRDPRIVLSLPRDRGRFATHEAQALLVSSVLHADAVLCMASTLALDAAVLDVPAIGVACAAVPGSPEDRLARDCYRTDHYRPVAESGAVPLAGSPEAMVAAACRAVREPGGGRAARRQLVTELCGPADGAASERIAGLVARLVTAARGAAR